MRIGIISTIGHNYSWAGSEVMWYGLANEALKTGYFVELNAASKICLSSQVKVLSKLGLKYTSRIDLSPITRRLANRGVYSRFSYMKKNPLDILCLSMGGPSDIFWIPDLLKFVLQTKIPYLVIVQANGEGIVASQKERDILKGFYERAKKVIFVSSHNRNLAKRQLSYNFDNSVIFPNPLRETIDEPLLWPDENPLLRFAMVARLEINDKQQDHLLEALSGDNWKNKKWRLTFYGTGPDEQHIRNLIKFYNLEDKVEIGGYVDSFKKIWSSHHMHILPSKREGMPLALIESMSCGRPAIFSRAGGVDELIDHGVNGFICPGMHPEVLSETLGLAWKQRNIWSKMGLSAFQKAKQINQEDWTKKLLSLVVQSS